MADLDPNDPNLDGDFVALLESRKTRADKPKEVISLSTLNVVEDNDHSEVPLKTAKKSTEQDLHKFQTELFKAAEDDDSVAVRSLCTKLIKEYSASKGVEPFQDQIIASNGMRHAIEKQSKKVSRFFVENGSIDFITAKYDVMVGAIPSQKTCLHILSEQGDMDLAKLLLDRLPKGKVRDEYIKETVLMKIEGQRPRHLSAIHITSLNGHTKFLEMLIDQYGVSANSTNSKNDTPVLWAARFNFVDTVRALIKRNADLNHRNDKGSTPLYWAVRYGMLEMVEVLIKEGKADIHQRRDLGLVSTIVMASALGHVDIVKILLQYGADVNTVITGGRTALHFAAGEGHTDIVEILLDYKAGIEDSDDQGLTPLLHAVQGGNIATINLLLSTGANISVKTHMGLTIWDYALKNDDDELIKNIVTLYKAVRRLKDKKLLLPPGRSPLHVCTMSADGKLDKIKLLLALGIDKDCEDLNGNTFYHIAAREDHSHILEEFLDDIDVNQQNSDGDTPLHHAARNGSVLSLEILLKKAKLDVKNSADETPLHIASRSQRAPPEAVERIVDVMVKAHNWKLIDDRDNRKNTALHLAARAGRVDVIPALAYLNPKLKNDHGDTPMHIAAKSSVSGLLEVMLDVFNTPEKGLDIDQPRADGETMLHICAKKGDADRVRILMRLGADISVTDHMGHTVLHDLAEKSVENTVHKEEILLVFKTIIDNAVWWWCTREDLSYPDEDSEVYRKYQQDAIFYLTQNLTNKNGHTVLNYTAAVGAADILQAMLNIDNVYRFRVGKDYNYDVTNLTPDTRHKNKQVKRRDKRSVGAMDPSEMKKNQSEIRTNTSRSCLEIIVDMEDTVLATQLLDVHPLNELVSNIWGAYQWMYLMFLCIHIAYMGLFSAFAIPFSADAIHNKTSSTTDPNAQTYQGLFLIWPLMILLIQCYNLVFVAVSFRKTTDHVEILDEGFSHDRDSRSAKLIGFINTVLNWLISNMIVWGGILFSILVIAWYALVVEESFDQIYLLTFALVTGWLFGIAFTKGFYSVHSFSIMLKHIIMKDIVRWFIIYIFILLGFAFAMHTLFQISPPIAESYPTAWHTLFTTFNMMIGMDEIFDENTDQDYSDYNSSSIYLRIIYIGYISISTIILLNLLIAMMTDTYNHILSREGTTWRISSVDMAFHIEKMLPCVPSLLKGMKLLRNRIKYDEEKQRWFLMVPRQNVQENKEVQDEQMRAIQRLEGKFTLLGNALQDITTQVEELNNQNMEIVDVITRLSQKSGIEGPRGGRKLSLVHERPGLQRPASPMKRTSYLKKL